MQIALMSVGKFCIDKCLKMPRNLEAEPGVLASLPNAWLKGFSSWPLNEVDPEKGDDHKSIPIRQLEGSFHARFPSFTEL